MLQAEGHGFDSDEVIGFFNCPNPSSRTMALESTQPLTEMSTRNMPGRKGRKGDLTAICEPTAHKMWKPRHLTTYGRARSVTGIALPFMYKDSIYTALYGKLDLWSYINQALLRINMDDNRSFPTPLRVSFLYRIVVILKEPQLSRHL
jgi:hypothetical protein